MPPIVVSLINLKGGVGKTTTTIQLAECLASEFEKNVLVIDLDPQTNASIALIDEHKWFELNRAGKTIAQLFKDQIDQTSVFDIEAAIQNPVSNLNLSKLSLLPSSLDLIGEQERISDIPLKTNYTLTPMEVLKQAIDPVLDRYDYVLGGVDNTWRI